MLCYRLYYYTILRDKFFYGYFVELGKNLLLSTLIVGRFKDFLTFLAILNQQFKPVTHFASWPPNLLWQTT